MSSEFEDVLLNNSIVLDNVRLPSPSRVYQMNITLIYVSTLSVWSLGNGQYKSGLRRSRPSQMLLPDLVRRSPPSSHLFPLPRQTELTRNLTRTVDV
jgi:hypothetical protein